MNSWTDPNPHPASVALSLPLWPFVAFAWAHLLAGSAVDGDADEAGE